MMKWRTLVYVALGIGALGAVALAVGRMQRGEKRAVTPISALQLGTSQVMQVKDLPGFIREATEESSHPANARVAVRKYDLNHDGEDEWLVSQIDHYAYDALDSVSEEGSRPTTIYQHRAQYGWTTLLYSIGDDVKFIPASKAGEYDEIEFEHSYATLNADGSFQHDRDFLIRLRWIDGEYQICQCRVAQSGEVVACRALRQGYSETIEDRGFRIHASCP